MNKEGFCPIDSDHNDESISCHKRKSCIFLPESFALEPPSLNNYGCFILINLGKGV